MTRPDERRLAGVVDLGVDPPGVEDPPGVVFAADLIVESLPWTIPAEGLALHAGE